MLLYTAASQSRKIAAKRRRDGLGDGGVRCAGDKYAPLSKLSRSLPFARGVASALVCLRSPRAGRRGRLYGPPRGNGIAARSRAPGHFSQRATEEEFSGCAQLPGAQRAAADARVGHSSHRSPGGRPFVNNTVRLSRACSWRMKHRGFAGFRRGRSAVPTLLCPQQND